LHYFHCALLSAAMRYIFRGERVAQQTTLVKIHFFLIFLTLDNVN